jgi:hypothetical protein
MLRNKCDPVAARYYVAQAALGAFAISLIRLVRVALCYVRVCLIRVALAKSVAWLFQGTSVTCTQTSTLAQKKFTAKSARERVDAFRPDPYSLGVNMARHLVCVSGMCTCRAHVTCGYSCTWRSV